MVQGQESRLKFVKGSAFDYEEDYDPDSPPLSDIDFEEPFDLITACNDEAKSWPDSKEDGAIKWAEIGKMSTVLLSNIESLTANHSFSEQVAICALVRHSFDHDNTHCRLKEWWVAIRQAVINSEQSFENAEDKDDIYEYITSFAPVVPNFGRRTKSRKFRMPAQLHAQVSRIANELGLNFSEYCQRLIMRSLSECESADHREEIRAEVEKFYRALERRIRVVIAIMLALRVEPCERLKQAIEEVKL